MNYRRCLKSDLITFASNRGLVVADTSRAQRGSIKIDYIQALQKADEEATFRFLDLPPEMRNLVYSEILDLQTRPWCEPAILATSTQIHKEATGLLYADHTIAVVIERDGVFAHRWRCGTYTPKQGQAESDYLKIEWPAFLRRIRHLRFTSGSLPIVRYEDQSPKMSLGFPNPLASVENTLHSLCRFLSNDHALLSFHLDIDWPLEGRDVLQLALHSFEFFREVPCIKLSGLGKQNSAVETLLNTTLNSPVSCDDLLPMLSIAENAQSPASDSAASGVLERWKFMNTAMTSMITDADFPFRTCSDRIENLVEPLDARITVVSQFRGLHEAANPSLLPADVYQAVIKTMQIGYDVRIIVCELSTILRRAIDAWDKSNVSTGD